VKKEVDAVIAKHRDHIGGGDRSLHDVLHSIPMEVWETGFPSVDLALRESIRLNMAGVSFRLNIGSENVHIGGSKEVIPPEAYAVSLKAVPLMIASPQEVADKLLP